MIDVRRTAAVLLVDRTVELREADEAFRWRRGVVLVGGVAAGALALLVVVGAPLVGALTPALAARLGVDADDVVSLAFVASVAVLGSAVLSFDGPTARAVVAPYDREALELLGVRPTEVVVARVVVTGAAATALAAWLVVTVALPLRTTLSPGPVVAACATLVLTTVAALAIRTSAPWVLAGRPLLSLRATAVRAAAALLAGLLGPVLLGLVLGDHGPAELWDRLARTAAPVPHLAAVAAADVVLAGAAVLLAVRNRPLRWAASAPAGTAFRVPRAWWPALATMPLQRLARSSSADAQDARHLVRWLVVGACGLVGLHLSPGPPAVWSATPPLLASTCGVLAVVAVTAAHPYSSLLALRGTRDVLFTAARPRVAVAAAVLAGSVTVPAVVLAELWAVLAWAYPALAGSAARDLVAALVVAAAVTFIADALLPTLRKQSGERLEVSLVHRIVVLLVFTALWALVVASTGPSSPLPPAAGPVLVCGGALLLACTVRPRRWESS